MDKLLIEDLQFHGHCGITEAERQVGQRLSLDLELLVDLRSAPSRDTLLGLVDYTHITRLVLEAGRKERFNLLESLADHLARMLLKECPVQEVVVRLKKYQPPVEEIRGYFGVEIRRKAGDD